MWEKEYNTLDMAEIYRQNYEDALDEIRNLKYKIAELEAEKRGCPLDDFNLNFDIKNY